MPQTSEGAQTAALNPIKTESKYRNHCVAEPPGERDPKGKDISADAGDWMRLGQGPIKTTPPSQNPDERIGRRRSHNG